MPGTSAQSDSGGLHADSMDEDWIQWDNDVFCKADACHGKTLQWVSSMAAALPACLCWGELAGACRSW